MPKPSPKQECVLRQLRRQKVLSMEQLMHQCDCSRMTVFQALKKYGYYSSYNYNAGFYSLIDIPRFDRHGLWKYDDKRFSRFRTLNETLVQLVENSQAGYTAVELEGLLEVECRHLLARLADQQRIVRQKQGRLYLYYGKQPQSQSRQKQARQTASPPPRATSPMLPPGLAARMVIRTLVVAIDQPQATSRELAARLRKEATPITAEQVQAIFDFYDLSEKRGS